MTATALYRERISSPRTEALFVTLTLLAFLVLVGLVLSSRPRMWIVVVAFLFAYFLFCALNYRTLVIQLTDVALELGFGLVAWRIPLHNIEACSLDQTSLWRIGGAGVHFTPLGGRYRAMFNFLEHPRLVIALRTRKGLVRDIAFSTCHPSEVMHLILQHARSAAS